MVESAVDDFKLDYSDLELEITESTLIHDAESAVQKLGQLNEMGVRIAIDDFGTGYSSLSYLHRLPFDVVKIDRSFVSAMHEDPRSLQITATIINLAKSLNKIVMAEGVETREQLELLRRMQCDAIQGFYISRPLTAAKAEDFVAQFRPVNLPALAKE
jgi:EAL domain-containing protein (putative c-di-GMP-specific phosphodiesterase class I)